MRYGRCGKEIRLTTTHAPHVSETASTKGHKYQNEFNLKFMLFVSPTHTVCGWGNNYWRLFWYCYVLFLQQYNLFTSCNYFLYAIILLVAVSHITMDYFFPLHPQELAGNYTLFFSLISAFTVQSSTAVSKLYDSLQIDPINPTHWTFKRFYDKESVLNTAESSTNSKWNCQWRDKNRLMRVFFFGLAVDRNNSCSFCCFQQSSSSLIVYSNIILHLPLSWQLQVSPNLPRLKSSGFSL